MAGIENSSQNRTEPTQTQLARYGYEKPNRRFLKERVSTIRELGDEKLMKEATRLYGENIAAFIARTEGQDRVGPELPEGQVRDTPPLHEIDSVKLAIAIDFGREMGAQGQLEKARDVFIAPRGRYDGASASELLNSAEGKAVVRVHKELTNIAEANRDNTNGHVIFPNKPLHRSLQKYVTSSSK